MTPAVAPLFETHPLAAGLLVATAVAVVGGMLVALLLLEARDLRARVVDLSRKSGEAGESARRAQVALAFERRDRAEESAAAARAAALMHDAVSAARSRAGELEQALAGAAHDLEHARQSVTDATAARVRDHHTIHDLTGEVDWARAQAAGLRGQADYYAGLYTRAAREAVGHDVWRRVAERRHDHLREVVRDALAAAAHALAAPPPPTPADLLAELEAQARADNAAILADAKAPAPENTAPATPTPAEA
jgi:hypothetical protein